MFAIKNKEDKWFLGFYWHMSKPVQFSTDQIARFDTMEEAAAAAAEVERVLGVNKAHLSIVEFEVRTVTPF